MIKWLHYHFNEFSTVKQQRDMKMQKIYIKFKSINLSLDLHLFINPEKYEFLPYYFTKNERLSLFLNLYMLWGEKCSLINQKEGYFGKLAFFLLGLFYISPILSLKVNQYVEIPKNSFYPLELLRDIFNYYGFQHEKKAFDNTKRRISLDSLDYIETGTEEKYGFCFEHPITKDFVKTGAIPEEAPQYKNIIKKFREEYEYIENIIEAAPSIKYDFEDIVD